MTLQEQILELENWGRTPKATIATAMAETGKKAMGCCPIYLPEEIVYASGLLPVGMWGGQLPLSEVDRYIQGFCCSIMRANMELGLSGRYRFLEGIIIPTLCDTMKSILANWTVAMKEPQVIPYTMLQNRQSKGSLQFIINQNQQLKAHLEDITGKEITQEQLESAFEVYEQYRQAMRKLVAMVADYPVTLNPSTRHLIMKGAWFTDKKVYTQKLEEMLTLLAQQPKEQARGPKVVLTGLMTEPLSLVDVFSDSNFVVVADDLAHQSRQFRTISRTEGTVMERIAYRMIDLRGDTFFYEENKSRGTMLIDAVKEHGADGVIVCMFKFCDPEEFDYPVYKKELEAAGIPMLYIEVDQQMESNEQIRTRVQSFAEMLR